MDLALNNSYINSKYCKKYITIDNDNLKKVLLKVRKPKYKDDIYYFQIKYEIEKYQNQIQIAKDEADKKEKDKTEYINPYVSYDVNNENKTEYSFIVGVIFTFLIEIGLSLPNFVSACLMPEVEKNKRDTIISGLFLNIIIHINFGGIIIGSSTNTEGKSFLFIASVVLFCIIIISVIIYLIYSFCYNVRI